MQWNDNINAGFTTGKPWIDIPSNYRNINVEKRFKIKILFLYVSKINTIKTYA